MALQAGTKLGPYEIESPIGSGGMGEVYKAHDPKLQRTVAIKVLAKQDEEASTRLLQEARAASTERSLTASGTTFSGSCWCRGTGWTTRPFNREQRSSNWPTCSTGHCMKVDGRNKKLFSDERFRTIKYWLADGTECAEYHVTQDEARQIADLARNAAALNPGLIMAIVSAFSGSRS